MKLGIVSDNNFQWAVDYHRLFVPHVGIEGVEIHFGTKLVEVLRSEPDAILVSRRFPAFEDPQNNSIYDLKKRGIKIIVDIDDYWHVPEYHSSYPIYSKGRSAEIASSIENADYVITTTNILHHKISDLNKNVVIIPNCIDHKAPQWKIKDIPDPHLRLCWSGGVTHKKDLTLLQGLFSEMWNSDISSEFTMMYMGKHGNDNFYWELFSHFGKAGNRYFSYPMTNPDKYGFYYDQADICLIPLFKDDFTACKSPLKMIEAGIKKKAVIVSNVLPYKEVASPNNCMLVDDDNGGWWDAVKFLRNNPQARIDMGEKLHEMIMQKYDFYKWQKTRVEFYNTL